MRKHPNVKVEKFRAMWMPQSAAASGTNAGAFQVDFGPKSNNVTLMVIVSDCGGWDHVSVHTEGRCPTWNEMQYIKELFFKDDEVAMQLHPAEKDYINCHPHTLHLWRPQTAAERDELEREFGVELDVPNAGPIPLPPKVMV